MKTFMLRKEDVEHKWYVIDAEGQVLGKVAALAASVLEVKISLHLLLMLLVVIMLLLSTQKKLF